MVNCLRSTTGSTSPSHFHQSAQRSGRSGDWQLYIPRCWAGLGAGSLLLGLPALHSPCSSSYCVWLQHRQTDRRSCRASEEPASAQRLHLAVPDWHNSCAQPARTGNSARLQMGCFCSKAAPEDEERTVHEEYPARLYSGLQVQVSAAEAGKPALQDWHVHGEATYLFAALCATSKACSRRAHEVTPCPAPATRTPCTACWSLEVTGTLRRRSPRSGTCRSRTACRLRCSTRCLQEAPAAAWPTWTLPRSACRWRARARTRRAPMPCSARWCMGWRARQRRRPLCSCQVRFLHWLLALLHIACV
jgi:hypothetical protein